MFVEHRRHSLTDNEARRKPILTFQGFVDLQGLSPRNHSTLCTACSLEAAFWSIFHGTCGSYGGLTRAQLPEFPEDQIEPAMSQGVVVFFPSFGYCEEVQLAWSGTGLMQQISSKKKVFIEPRASSRVEATLRDYADSMAVQEGRPGKGAVLLCVVGGKMSEGINFGDGLGR